MKELKDLMVPINELVWDASEDEVDVGGLSGHITMS